MAKEKADRYQSLTDLHNDLLAVKSGKPLTTQYFNNKRVQEAYDDEDDYGEDEEDDYEEEEYNI